MTVFIGMINAVCFLKGKFMNIFKKFVGSVTAVAVMLAAVPQMNASAASVKLPDNEAIEFSDNLGAAWNLGNAFDAVDCSWISNELDYESAWCGAKTTRALIKEIKDIGFDTIRIPVSWHNHVDSKFNISGKWIDRVKEVVDWSLDEGLNVILNVHHDVERGYYYPLDEEYKTSEKYMKAVWSQIAEKFKSYDERLIFEIINEPRMKGIDPSIANEWWFNVSNPDKATLESIECINKLNQVSLDAIRGAGGKNKSRYVLVGGTRTSVDGLEISSFRLPEDSVENRLIVDFHLYTKSESTYKSVIDKVYKKFVSKGIPAILSEYGINEGSFTYDDKSADYLYGLVEYARERGITCAIWDNNDPKVYQLIDRSTLKWSRKDVAEAAVKAGKPNGGSSSSSSSDKKTETLKKASVTAEQNGFWISLSWSKVDGASKYRLYRADTKNGKKKLLKETKSLKLTDKTAATGEDYYYFVKAYNSKAKKWSGYSAAEYVSVKKSEAATSVSKVTKNGNNVKLSWKSVEGGDKYRVYRSETKGGKKTELATTSNLSYTDKKAKSGKTYYYYIKVYDSATKKWSTYSNAKKVTI